MDETLEHYWLDQLPILSCLINLMPLIRTTQWPWPGLGCDTDRRGRNFLTQSSGIYLMAGEMHEQHRFCFFRLIYI